MLLEFDADQRLWQETVRDAVSKQCPASLIRDIAENGVDPAPLWNSYLDAGWTELTDPENAVELAIGCVPQRCEKRGTLCDGVLVRRADRIVDAMHFQGATRAAP